MLDTYSIQKDNVDRRPCRRFDRLLKRLKVPALSLSAFWVYGVLWTMRCLRCDYPFTVVWLILD